MERILNGRYQVGPKLGDGGMAVVYRGYDTLLGRSVAIKVLRDQYAADPQFLARFEREAQAVAALNHPNIINIFDVGVDGGSHYFVMELIDGPNLKEVIRARGPLPVEETVGIMLQVLAGLGYAHARGIVHRDIKPQNILLLSDGVAKVTDFGIAKGLADATLTEAGSSMGTVHYLSPEQARGEPVLPSSDLYAAGVMLYEALTGVLPFTSDSAVGVAVKHINEIPKPPAQVRRTVPPQLSVLTLHALQKDPARRFTSAPEMAAALRNWQSWTPKQPRRAAPRQPPPRGAAATVARPPVVPPPRRGAGSRAQRDRSGCVTWLIGGLILAALLALFVAGYRLSPFGVREPTPAPPIVAFASPTAEATVLSVEPSPTPARAPSSTVPASPTVPPTVAPQPSPPTATRPLPTATPLPAIATVTPVPAPTVTPTIALAVAPNLIGKTLAQAQEIAAAEGFAVEQVEERNSSSAPRGQIMLQNPGPGEQTTPGKTIRVVVSRGPSTAPVPSVTGLTYEQAMSQLETAGFTVKQITAVSRAVPKGQVIAQDPPGGANAAVGTAVTLTVSDGDLIVVPNVVGMNYETAAATLRQAGFNVTSINGMTRAQIQAENPRFFTTNPNVADGEVISQTLPARGAYERGTAIGIAYYKAR